MILIGLPGRGPETEAWMGRLLTPLKLGQDATVVAHYQHWDTKGEADVAREAELLEFKNTDYLIAKSLGTMVALAALTLRGTLPARLVLIGTPTNNFSDLQKEQLRLVAGETRCLFIQQNRDFTGHFSEVDDLVRNIDSVQTIEIAGEDHVYSNTDELAAIIASWLSE